VYLKLHVNFFSIPGSLDLYSTCSVNSLIWLFVCLFELGFWAQKGNLANHKERLHKSLGCSNGSEKYYGTVHVHNLHTCELFKIMDIFFGILGPKGQSCKTTKSVRINPWDAQLAVKSIMEEFMCIICILVNCSKSWTFFWDFGPKRAILQNHEEHLHKSLGCSIGSEKYYGRVHVHNLHTFELFKIIDIFLEFWVKT
jgi:hypothetical protein